MNNVKLLHMKCCFFQFFNCPVALKNKNFWPLQEKVEMTPLAPAYLSDMVTATADLSGRGRLRSSNTFRYELSLLKGKFGERSFSFAGPKAWNDLPFSIQELTDTCTFKRQLKCMFTQAYTNCSTSVVRM